MSFDHRDIRPSMDVYTFDNLYLGTVLKIIPGPVQPVGVYVPQDARQSSASSGELRGPMPTAPLGNPGPATQAARSAYATAPDRAEPLGQGMMVVGKWWGLVDRQAIALDSIQTVALERIVLQRSKVDFKP